MIVPPNTDASRRHTADADALMNSPLLGGLSHPKQQQQPPNHPQPQHPQQQQQRRRRRPHREDKKRKRKDDGATCLADIDDLDDLDLDGIIEQGPDAAGGGGGGRAPAATVGRRAATTAAAKKMKASAMAKAKKENAKKEKKEKKKKKKVANKRARYGFEVKAAAIVMCDDLARTSGSLSEARKTTCRFFNIHPSLLSKWNKFRDKILAASRNQRMGDRKCALPHDQMSPDSRAPRLSRPLAPQFRPRSPRTGRRADDGLAMAFHGTRRLGP